MMDRNYDYLPDGVDELRNEVAAADKRTEQVESELADAEARAAAAEQRAVASEAACAAMRKALEFTLPFREFSDEWHCMGNREVVHFRVLRSAALASDAGAALLAELSQLRTDNERLKLELHNRPVEFY